MIQMPAKTALIEQKNLNKRIYLQQPFSMGPLPGQEKHENNIDKAHR